MTFNLAGTRAIPNFIQSLKNQGYDDAEWNSVKGGINVYVCGRRLLLKTNDDVAPLVGPDALRLPRYRDWGIEMIPERLFDD